MATACVRASRCQLCGQVWAGPCCWACESRSRKSKQRARRQLRAKEEADRRAQEDRLLEEAKRQAEEERARGQRCSEAERILELAYERVGKRVRSWYQDAWADALDGDKEFWVTFAAFQQDTSAEWLYARGYMFRKVDKRSLWCEALPRELAIALFSTMERVNHPGGRALLLH